MSKRKDRSEQAGGERKGPQFRVDEQWKKSVAQDRERATQDKKAESAPAQEEPAGKYPEPDFRVLLAGLYSQTLMALGEMEHPVTKKRAADMREAQYLVDTIDMLRTKTKGNLSPEEESYVNGLLHDLRMRYVNAVERERGKSQETGK